MKHLRVFGAAILTTLPLAAWCLSPLPAMGEEPRGGDSEVRSLVVDGGRDDASTPDASGAEDAKTAGEPMAREANPSQDSSPSLAASSGQDDLLELTREHENDLPDGSYSFLPTDVSSRALTAGDAGLLGEGALRVQEADEDVSQVWSVTHDDDGFVIVSSASTGLVLGVPNGKANEGTALQLRAANGSRAQRWIALAQEDGSVVLVSALDSSMAVCPRTQEGEGLELRSLSASPAQKWMLSARASERDRLDALATRNASLVKDGAYALKATPSSRKVLDVRNGSGDNFANVQLWESNGSRAQRWAISHDAKGYLTIKNVGSGKVLDVLNGSAADGANIQQYEGNDSYAQKWIAVPDSFGGVTLVSGLRADFVLDVAAGRMADGANVQVWTANGTRAQSISLVPASSEAPAPSGNVLDGSTWYSLEPVCASGKSVEVSGASTEDRANIQIGEGSGKTSQLFAAEYVGGYYRFRNVASGKALDVAGGDVVPGTNVAQWAPVDGNANQLFAAIKNDDGTYSFVNKATGLALDVAGASSANGANVDAYTPNGTGAQRFRLKTMGSVDIQAGVYTICPEGNSSLSFDVENGSKGDGANVRLWSSNETNAQKWYVSPVSGERGVYTIENVNSAKRLAVDEGGNVSQRPSSNDDSQRWHAVIVGTSISFESVSQKGKSLDIAGGRLASGSNVQVYGTNGSSAQRFRLVSSAAAVTNGTYTVGMASSSEKVLETAGSSSSNGANVQIWQRNGSGGQVWEFSRNADGTFTIKNAASGKVLDAKDGRAASGTNVWQWESNGSAAQRWRISYAGGGYRISSAMDDSLVLDVASGSTSDGANVQLWKDNGSPAQRFALAEATYIDPIIRDAKWIGASYFSPGRLGNDWNVIVIHISECPTLSAIDNTFTDGGRQASAHFGVGGREIHQYVNLGDTAWAVGNWNWNLRTVSIEHVGTTNNPPSRETLDTSAQLMAALARMRGWSRLVLGENVGIHKWYSSTSCPGPTDVTWLVKRANEYLGSGVDGSYVEGGAVPQGLPSSENAAALRTLLDPENLMFWNQGAKGSLL